MICRTTFLLIKLNEFYCYVYFTYLCTNKQNENVMKDYNVGDLIRFAEEKKPYRVRACDGRYLVCTKPFNLRPHTVQYTIVDLFEEIRGTDGYVFSPYDYYSDEDCNNYLSDLQHGEAEISKRNIVKLNIVE